MDTDFVFNELTESDIRKFADEAYVFNRNKEDIEKEKILLMSFSDESFGDSEEKLDVAVKSKDKEWCLLNINDKIDSYNEIPLGYLLNGIEYDKVLVILRRMSNLIYDKNKVSSNSYIYSIISDEYKNIVKHPDLSGLLARKRIYLDRGYNELLSDIKKRFDGDDLEMIIDAIRVIKGE